MEKHTSFPNEAMLYILQLGITFELYNGILYKSEFT